MDEFGSEVSYFISEPRYFIEVTILSEDARKTWLNSTLKEINNLINNQDSLVEYPEKGKQVNPCMYVYKEKNQYYGSLDKLKLRIVVIEDLQNKELVGDTWSTTAKKKL